MSETPNFSSVPSDSEAPKNVVPPGPPKWGIVYDPQSLATDYSILHRQAEFEAAEYNVLASSELDLRRLESQAREATLVRAAQVFQLLHDNISGVTHQVVEERSFVVRRRFTKSRVSELTTVAKGWELNLKGSTSRSNSHLILADDGRLISVFAVERTLDKDSLKSLVTSRRYADNVEIGEPSSNDPMHSFLDSTYESDIGARRPSSDSPLSRAQTIVNREIAIQQSLAQLLIDNEIKIPIPANQHVRSSETVNIRKNVDGQKELEIADTHAIIDAEVVEDRHHRTSSVSHSQDIIDVEVTDDPNTEAVSLKKKISSVNPTKVESSQSRHTAELLNNGAIIGKLGGLILSEAQMQRAYAEYQSAVNSKDDEKIEY